VEYFPTQPIDRYLIFTVFESPSPTLREEVRFTVYKRVLILVPDPIRANSRMVYYIAL
jgi:hypothetical protein